MKPYIRKLGTVECDLVETNPIVFRERLYRLDSVRTRYWKNTSSTAFFRFVDYENGFTSEPFAWGYHFGNAFVDGDSIYVTGVNPPDGDCIDIFFSKDMAKWKKHNALRLPGHGIFNTSICKAKDVYVMMFEIGKPEEVAGVRFTARFATSLDMKKWELTPEECIYAKDRYTAPHCLRFLDPFFYNFYLEKRGGTYEQHVVRSKDLVKWELSPLNPVLKASDEDRKIANLNIPLSQRKRIATAININNSDIDFCEYDGRLVIYYSWGNQKGIEHLAEAEYGGTLCQFLEAWYP